MKTQDAFLTWYMNAAPSVQHRLRLAAKWEHGFDGFPNPEDEIGDTEEEWQTALDDRKPVVRFLAALLILCKHRQYEAKGRRVTRSPDGIITHTTIAPSRNRNPDAALDAVRAEWKLHGENSQWVRLETLAAILNISETEAKKRLTTPGTEENAVLKPVKRTARTVVYDGLEAALLSLKAHWHLWQTTSTTAL
jgi:hypothetical protein